MFNLATNDRGRNETTASVYLPTLARTVAAVDFLRWYNFGASLMAPSESLSSEESKSFSSEALVKSYEPLQWDMILNHSCIHTAVVNTAMAAHHVTSTSNIPPPD